MCILKGGGKALTRPICSQHLFQPWCGPDTTKRGATLLDTQHKLQISFHNERLNTMTICPSHRAKLRIVSSRSCRTRGRVTVRKRGVAKKWKRTGEKGIWNYLTRDWFACKSWIRWVLYSLVDYPNISQVMKFRNRTSFSVTMVTCHISQSSNSTGELLEAPLISQDTLM